MPICGIAATAAENMHDMLNAETTCKTTSGELAMIN
jgi:hypothetical protein